MRLTIVRTRMAMRPREDGRVAVGYEIYVPVEDVLPGADVTTKAIIDADWKREYSSYVDATWVTNLAPGFERYDRFLAHEAAARAEMLAVLRRECPETRGLARWPLLWAWIEPDEAGGPYSARIEVADHEPGGSGGTDQGLATSTIPHEGAEAA